VSEGFSRRVFRHEGFRRVQGVFRRGQPILRLRADGDLRPTDYNRYQYNQRFNRWEGSLAPFTYDSLQVIYGPDSNPNLIPRSIPWSRAIRATPTSSSPISTPQFWNQSDLTNPLGIHRVYPDAEPNDPGDTTEDGFHRFYEYEYILDNLAPSRPLYVSVTAFDYGSRVHQLSSLESSLLANATLAYPLTGVDEVERRGLGVIVYPNPYRIDGGYARAGYENRDRTKSAERARAIHFANLPHICTIRIYTLAGDLVQEIKHYRPDAAPTPSTRHGTCCRATRRRSRPAFTYGR